MTFDCKLEKIMIKNKDFNYQTFTADNNEDDKKKVFDVGFSGHHKGIAFDIAAYTLGANYIERHFTLDRAMKGPDHALSLSPSGMDILVKRSKMLFDARGREEKFVTDSELKARKKFRGY